MLWRRYAGPAVVPTFPLVIENDVLVVEWREDAEGQPQQALSRVDAGSGQLRWRLEIDDQVSAPVLLGGQVLLAGESGKLHVVDASSGQRTGYVQFAQPLRAPPTVNPNAGVIYLPGDRSSVYTLSASDFSCLGVFYTNHGRGAIVAAPAFALDKVVIVENDAARTCQMRVYSIDASGALSGMIAEQRLAGSVQRQPLVEGRRVTVLTDRGFIGVFEVSVGPDGEPLTTLATRAARNASPYVRYGRANGGQIWVAEGALAKYSISPAGNRLTVEALTNDYNRSQFVAPLEIRDNVMFHARAQRGRAGYTVTACSIDDGSPYWATDLAVPPAGGPLASQSPVALLEANANGQVFRFDAEALRTRVQSQALPAPADSDQPIVYESGQLLTGGGAVFASPGERDVLLYSPSGNKPLVRVRAALTTRHASDRLR